MKKQINQQKSLIDELLENGTTTLTANSREAIYKDADELVGLIPEDVKWTRSAVEHCNGTFTQKYSLI